MSIMELRQVGYSYDNRRKVLKGVNADWNGAAFMRFWVLPAAAKPRCFP